MTGCLALLAPWLALQTRTTVNVELNVFECDLGTPFEIPGGRFAVERDGFTAYGVDEPALVQFKALSAKGRITLRVSPKLRAFDGQKAEVKVMGGSGERTSAFIVRITPKLLANRQWEFLTEVSDEAGIGRAKHVEWALRARPMTSLNSMLVISREVGSPNRRRIVTFLRATETEKTP